MNSHRWQQHATTLFQTVMPESQHSSSCSGGTQSTNSTRYCIQPEDTFNDDSGLPNLEALKNIYQVVAQQLLNSREHYMKKHHNQQ